MAKHTLLIYEMNPETVDLYLLPEEIFEKHRDYLLEAHGKIVNSDELNSGMEFLMSALASNPDHVDEDCRMKLYACCLHQFKVSDGKLLEADIVRVVRSGFFL